MFTILSNLLSAIIFGAGVSIGGMTDGRRLASFFSFTTDGKFWDTSLLIVFMSAVIVNTIAYQLIIRPKRILTTPICAPAFNIPCRVDITKELITGSLLFGVGWAFATYCPGPGLVNAIITLKPQPLAFIGAVMVGMSVFKLREYQYVVASKKEEAPVGFGSSGLVVVLSMAAMLYGLLYASQTNDKHKLLPQPPIYPLVGGILIGLSAALKSMLCGDVLGMSGIISGLVSPLLDWNQKFKLLVFLCGTVVGGLLVQHFVPYPTTCDYNIGNNGHGSEGDSFFYADSSKPISMYIIGGLLVGYGTSLSNGCTSGHGICGLARFSPRSLAAVISFMGACTATTMCLNY